MSQSIHRIYGSDERAAEVALALTEWGFTEVHVFPPAGAGGAGRAGASLDDIVAALTNPQMKHFVLRANARKFAPALQRGAALVTVHAPFGVALPATQIVDEFDPIDCGVSDFNEPLAPWDEAAPLSSALMLPVLLPDSATFARFWNVPALSKSSRTTGSALGLPELTSSRGPFTGTFGGPLLSNKATILSSLLGLPVLTKPRK